MNFKNHLRFLKLMKEENNEENLDKKDSMSF
jgi:hypothetical protein